ncbi:MAG TPA: ATP-binding protein [Pyrinomonadaceae bacterium]|jgi:anti-sigma regulatory factor (Ser/Thr protein kinase)
MSERKNVKSAGIRQILSRIAAADFVGRERERDEILGFARAGKDEKASGLLVLSAPAAGASELLRQVYDRLFAEESDIFPIYFAFQANETAETAARRFLQTFLQQAVAFRRKDAKLLDAALELAEIARLASPTDGAWIDRLIFAYEDESQSGDPGALVRQVFAAPLRAATQGAPCFVIFDDFHEANEDLINEIKQIYARSTARFVIGGRRRFLLDALQNGGANLENARVLNLPLLSPTDAGFLVEKLAAKYAVKTNEQTRDLIVQQLNANPTFITNLILSARDRNVDLDSFRRCEQVYAAEILGGRTRRYFNRIFERVVPNLETQREILNVLKNAFDGEANKSSIEFWQNRVAVETEDFNRIMRALHLNEIVRVDSSVVETVETSDIARDYVTARYRLEIKNEPRSLVVAETLATALKRAPETMARFYRRSSALGLRSVLQNFNLQEIPTVLFDYHRFRRFYKGEDDQLINENLASETEKNALPQIVFAANCAEFYPQIERIAERERSAVAVGFESGHYRDDSQIVWIAAEIESKLEATAELTEFWLDRLEAVAVFCNFRRAQFWLVAPEGFSEEASRLLDARAAFSSSRRQVELLAEMLEADLVSADREKGNEFELIMPMGGDTELISARAAEDFARKYDFKTAAINQIKTALIESCINAAEHSLSPDRKIHQKFEMQADKLVITISNRGLQIPPEKLNGSKPEENPTGRRGLGLRLIRRLMDEVEFIRTDDGTIIRMTKRK